MKRKPKPMTRDRTKNAAFAKLYGVEPGDVLRVPVNFRWDALNWDFIKLLSEIAHYAAGKYGAAEQYANGRLEGEKSPINHMYEHLREFQAGVLHDHFGTMEHQLAAVAYGAMMEYLYVKRFGHKPSVLFGVEGKKT